MRTRLSTPVRFLIAVTIFIALVVGGGYAYWSSAIAAPEPAALAALRSDDRVILTEASWIDFAPTSRVPDTGLVVYPGGLVDARAYAPVARAIAAEGYLVAVVPVPLNFAILAPDGAAEVISAHPEVRYWAVGGHSLGGVAAVDFAGRHPETVSGLALWASYPAASTDLSGSGLSALSVSAENDRLTTAEKVASTRGLLPPDTRYVVVAGGNHARFGRYGPQRGDGVASIDAAEQQARVVAATVDLLRSLGSRANRVGAD